jgi:hypothetical protein
MVTTYFAPASCESSLSEGSERCELMNKPFALEKDHLPPLGGNGKGALYRGFDGKVRFYFIRRPCLLGLREIRAGMLWQRASLSIRAPSRNLEVGSFTGDAERQLKVGSGKGASLPMGAL